MAGAVQNLTVSASARLDLPARLKKVERREHGAFGFNIALPRNPPIADSVDRVARIGARRDVAKDRIGKFVNRGSALFHRMQRTSRCT